MNIYSYMVRHKNGWGTGFGPRPTHCATCSNALPAKPDTGASGYGVRDEETVTACEHNGRRSELSTCGSCRRQWCSECDPGPAALCPFCCGGTAHEWPKLKPGECYIRSKAHCYACCAEHEKARMIESGRATLYLSHDDTEQSKGNLEASELRSGRWAVAPAGQLGTCGFYPYPWTVQYVTAGNPADAIKRARAQLKKWVIGNWSGGLSFPCITMHKGSHNIARVRYDVTFRGPDGKQWRGTTYGDNTQICHCRRLKVQS